MSSQQHQAQGKHLVRNLRTLMPDADLNLAELYDLIDRLAAAVRLDAPVETDYMPDEVAHHQFCRLRFEDTDLPIAGICYWDSHERLWAVARNRNDNADVRRFTLWHELGHITWHGWHDRLFPGLPLKDMHLLSEFAADYFAGEVLMPRRLVERAFSDGIQDPAELARHFRVSEDAMRWKLAQTDLPFVSSDDQPIAARTTSNAVTPRTLGSTASHRSNLKGGTS